MSKKVLFLKEKYLKFLLDGSKILEGRVGYDNIKRFKVGDYVYLNGKYKAQIMNIWIYSTFEEALEHHDYKLLIPDANSQEEALNIYNSLYPKWKQKRFGVYILNFNVCKNF